MLENLLREDQFVVDFIMISNKLDLNHRSNIDKVIISYYNICNLYVRIYAWSRLMNSELTEIIHLNTINEEILYDALHKDILESVLSEIC
jgi:hypothetical protein